jgi:hypothetical protein
MMGVTFNLDKVLHPLGLCHHHRWFLNEKILIGFQVDASLSLTI